MNQELDALNSRKGALGDELAMSQVKKEAVVHYDQLREVEDKRDQVMNRADGKSQVRQCLGFRTADFGSSLAYESAEEKPKHYQT